MFEQRRTRAMERMVENSGMILFAGREKTRIHDTHYVFRQENRFLYMTGFPEPDAVALILPNHPEHKFVLFVRKRDKDMEIWNGRRFGPEGAVEKFGACKAFDLEEIEEKLPEYLQDIETLYHSWGADAKNDQRLAGWLRKVRMKVRKGFEAPSKFIELSTLVDEMRLIKDEGDLVPMRKAAQLSMQAFRHGIKFTEAGLNERQVQSEMEHYCRMRGSPAQAYNSIVAGGENATILHYNENDMQLNDGEMLLVDFGCEIDGYASDITRTWPVNGKFTEDQKIIYDLVLKSQQAAIDTLQVGRDIHEMYVVSCEVIAQGLIDLGILGRDAKTHALIATGDDTETELEEDEPRLRDFYMHGCGHWIGMDVHDCGAYRPKKEWRKLEEGMCTTVEPGLYFSKNNKHAPERFHGIGIRIEDDVLVTKDGPVILTEGLPRTSEEVEACWKNG
ncbi:MAG: aminopeptidase P N-terminal domain-containing protein [Planctomycetes bacterium]|nr:aminopeptidase P N-terminal domain-containing protein [Planctomycetota bacterium]